LKLQWKSSSFEVTNKVDALSSTQFKDFVTANGTAAQIALLVLLMNWQDEIFRTAIDHNIALSGGTDNVVYRASVDMLI
jgi:iron complex outermembrane receptor protein